jgi:Erv1 / Alr family
MVLDPKVWGPHYWFFLHTISMSYPLRPNSVTKKKYYEFIQNLPLFIPVESIAGEFSKLLDQYPITPYLDSRDSFIRWVWFIHNKINEKLEKNKISLNKFYELYYEEYKPKDIKNREMNRLKNKLVYLCLVILFVAMIVYLYNK